MELLWALGGALAGAVFAAWRLRGDGSTLDAVTRVIRYDGPKPTIPK